MRRPRVTHVSYVYGLESVSINGRLLNWAAAMCQDLPSFMVSPCRQWNEYPVSVAACRYPAHVARFRFILSDAQCPACACKSGRGKCYGLLRSSVSVPGATTKSRPSRPPQASSKQIVSGAIMHWQGYTYDRGVYYACIGWILTIIAVAAVSIRFYSRTFLTRSVGSDDFAILVSIVSISGRNFHVRALTMRKVLSFVGQINDTLAVAQGMGRHTALLNNDQYSQVQKW